MVRRSAAFILAFALACSGDDSTSSDAAGNTGDDGADGDGDGDDTGDSSTGPTYPEPEPFSVAISTSDGACGVAFGSDEAEREAMARTAAGCGEDCFMVAATADQVANAVVVATGADATQWSYSYQHAETCEADGELALQDCDMSYNGEGSCAIACSATLPGC